MNNVNVSGPIQPTSIYKTKVLKGNHSFASQVTEPNMKYVIKHDFVLNGDVTIPENCVLKFDGGSLSNGYITGNQNTEYINGVFNNIYFIVQGNNIIKGCVFNPGEINTSATSYACAALEFKNTSNIKIQDCVFNDGRLGIYTHGCSNIVVENCKFRNYTYWGNYFECLSDSSIINNECINVNDGLKFAGCLDNVIISGNRCHNNVRDGIDFSGIHAKGVTITDNICFDNGSGVIEFKAMFGTRTKTLEENVIAFRNSLTRYEKTVNELEWAFINISNNIGYDCRGGGIHFVHFFANLTPSDIYEGNDDHTAVKNRISNIIVSNNNIFKSYYAISFSAYSDIPNSIQITGNNFIGSDNAYYAAYISNSHYVLFTNNTIFNAKGGLKLQNDADAYYNQGLSSVEVRRNNIYTTKNECVCVDNIATNITIIDNTLKTLQAAHKIVNNSSTPIFMANNMGENTRLVGSSRPYPYSEDTGFRFFDEVLCKPIYWNGNLFLDSEGHSAIKTIGFTENRPVGKHEEGGVIVGELDPTYDRGFKYFDVELGIPVYADIINPNTGEVTWKTSCIGNRRPTPHESDLGLMFFDTSLGKPIWIKSIDTSTDPITVIWVDEKGFTATATKGTIRPTGTGGGGVLDATRDIGFEFFDTNPGVMKPIYASAIANDGTVTWVDATGATV